MKNLFFEITEFRNFSKLKTEKKQIVFYSENPSQWDFYENIIKLLIKKNTICYITSSKEEFKKNKIKNKNFFKFYLGSGIIRTIFFSTLKSKILVMSLPDLNKFHIKRSKYPVFYIFIPHNLLSTHMIFRKNAFDHYDSFFSSGEHQNKEIRESENIYKTKKKELVNFGCCRLDKIIKLNSEYKRKRNEGITVLISPSWGKNGLLESNSIELIKSIIKNKIKIILRPHPDTIRLNPESINKLTKTFKNNKYFILKPDISSIDDYFEVDLMISDWSGSAFEFAFGTLKPVIFVNMPKKINNPDYIKFKNKPIEIEMRKKIGSVVERKDINKIPFLIKDLIKNEKKWKKKILNLRDKEFFNINKSGKVGAEFILKKINEENHNY